MQPHPAFHSHSPTIYPLTDTEPAPHFFQTGIILLNCSFASCLCLTFPGGLLPITTRGEMDLCDDCQSFALALSQKHESLPVSHLFMNPVGAALLKSGSCRLCTMIHDWIIHYDLGRFHPLTDWHNGNNTLYCGAKRYGFPIKYVGVRAFRSIEFHMKFAVWCDKSVYKRCCDDSSAIG